MDPQYFMISLTDRCNLRCLMCGCAESTEKYAGEELTSADLKDLIDQIYAWTKKAEIVFSGGEPFVKKDFTKFLNYVCSRGMKLNINTNGMFINEAVARLIVERGVNHITFSLDGDSAQVNDPIRGKGVFDRVLQSIRYIVDEKKKQEKATPVLSLNVTIMRQNIHGLARMVALAHTIGIDSIMFQPVVGDNSNVSRRETNILLTKQEMSQLRKVLKTIKQQAQEKHIDVQIPESALLEQYFTMQDITKQHKLWKCFVGYTRVSVSSFGHVFSCSESFGNIKDMKLKAIWHSQKAKQMRKKFKKCKCFCLQTCYARPESESLYAVIKNAWIKAQ